MKFNPETRNSINVYHLIEAGYAIAAEKAPRPPMLPSYSPDYNSETGVYKIEVCSSIPYPLNVDSAVAGTVFSVDKKGNINQVTSSGCRVYPEKLGEGIVLQDYAVNNIYLSRLQKGNYGHLTEEISKSYTLPEDATCFWIPDDKEDEKVIEVACNILFALGVTELSHIKTVNRIKTKSNSILTDNSHLEYEDLIIDPEVVAVRGKVDIPISVLIRCSSFDSSYNINSFRNVLNTWIKTINHKTSDIAEVKFEKEEYCLAVLKIKLSMFGSSDVEMRRNYLNSIMTGLRETFESTYSTKVGIRCFRKTR